jgi:membrane-associated phospholipid phosphatase
MKVWIASLFAILNTYTSLAQAYDTLIGDSAHQVKGQVYHLAGTQFIYPKPTVFTFLKNIPGTFAHGAKESFKKKSIPAWGVIVGSTAALLIVDQSLSDKTQQFSRFIGLDYSRRYINLIQFKLGSKPVNVYQAPDNFNTALYSAGEGWPAVLISLGMLTHGAIKNDYRSLSTAGQIMQANITVGITTQILKRITGRESPFAASQSGGKWSPVPPLSTYQKSVSRYDAFPSGHMTTMMSTITVLAMNYPEKKWIRPIGYTVMTIVGFSMVNNGVHWASDYPLAIGIGYVVGKVTVKMNRIMKESGKRK